MSNDDTGWFSASDLSLLGERLVAGLPKTMSGCMRRAKKEDWLSREVKGSGGPGGILTEYQPPAPVLALIQLFLEVNPGFFKSGKTRSKADLTSICGDVPTSQLSTALPVVQADLDRPRFLLAIEAVEEGLSAAGRNMPAARKAELILGVYDMMADPVNTKARVLQLVKLAA